MRKQVEAEARKQFVVDEASKLFAKNGVENTNMEQIAKAAGYTRRTLYSYFKSHDEICLLVHMAHLRERWAYQQGALNDARTGRDKLRAWGMSLYEYLQQNQQVLNLEVYWDFRGMEKDRIGDDVFKDFQLLNNELAEGLRSIVNLGKDDLSLKSDLNTDLCVSQFIYTLRAVLHRAFSTGYSFCEIDAREYVVHFLGLFIDGLSLNGVTHE